MQRGTCIQAQSNTARETHSLIYGRQTQPLNMQRQQVVGTSNFDKEAAWRSETKQGKRATKEWAKLVYELVSGVGSIMIAECHDGANHAFISFPLMNVYRQRNDIGLAAAVANTANAKHNTQEEDEAVTPP